MDRNFSLSGLGTIVPPAPEACANGFNLEFHPDEQGVAVTNPKRCKGTAQLMRDGTFFFTAAKKRVRNNKLRMARAPHGWLSSTRDEAMKLTLRVPFSEPIDWRRAFVCETIELFTPILGRKSMRFLLKYMLNQLK